MVVGGPIEPSLTRPHLVAPFRVGERRAIFFVGQGEDLAGKFALPLGATLLFLRRAVDLVDDEPRGAFAGTRLPGHNGRHPWHSQSREAGVAAGA